MSKGDESRGGIPWNKQRNHAIGRIDKKKMQPGCPEMWKWRKEILWRKSSTERDMSSKIILAKVSSTTIWPCFYWREKEPLPDKHVCGETFKKISNRMFQRLMESRNQGDSNWKSKHLRTSKLHNFQLQFQLKIEDHDFQLPTSTGKTFCFNFQLQYRTAPLLQISAPGHHCEDPPEHTGAPRVRGGAKGLKSGDPKHTKMVILVGKPVVG